MKQYTEQEMRKIIVERYSKPQNFSEQKPNLYIEAKLKLDTCSDQLNLFIKTANNLIIDVKFNGTGCAIATASADILCEMMKNQSFEKAGELLNEYTHLIEHDQEVDTNLLNDLIVFQNVHKQRARKKCATLFSNGIFAIIKGENNEK
ncbi:FeS assembly protein [Williamsoniiplasma luminosum]|uniref:FeS assembly protein n=1 Tax=Williamsoniiplasma luminosum TaxID=214888 RepID=A0A2K8NTM6_9MOLU|nr:SUF system NifU family Fe-S cluster assembly protein [Williamsoniiplasma luminosum]ATZ17117.1 FeS assembly protein [Williamsoniiplasma luminosum]